MKLMVCVNRFSDFKTVVDEIRHKADTHTPMPDPLSGHYIYSVPYLQHEIDFCETGYGLFQTTFKVTKALSQKKYHLALKVSFCNAYKPELEIGDIVNVIKDKPDSTMALSTDNTLAADMYELEWMNKESYPHFKGAFINMNNSYMNVMMPFKKVVSLTTGQYGDSANYAAKREKYKADIETTDGLGFVYPCMSERQPFYQLCCVERHLGTGSYEPEKAKDSMNETLFDILQKL